MIVIKRDGTKVPFDRQKIVNAVNKALTEVDGCLYETETAEEIATVIEAHVMGARLIGEPLSVEDIQDRVEDLLMQSERRDVARAYIRYRYKKEVARNYKDDFITAIGEKLSASNVQNQNANLDEKSFGGRIGEASSYMTKDYALNYIVSDMARENHLGNMVYIHDLDAYAVGSHNCLTIPFDKLLAEGFNTRQCDVRPANSVNTAFQLVAVIFQLQSLCQFGGVSASHIDWTMVPYVRKSFTKHMKDGLKFCEGKSDYKIERFGKWLKHESEDGTLHFDNKEFKELHSEAWNYALEMTEREIYQAVEAMYHNLNTLQSRSGNQLPFTSINYGTCTLPEGRMVTKAILDVSIKGLGKLHKTSIFPCGIFQVMKGVNKEPGTPNYDLYRLALRSTAQRLYPNYANVDWSVNKGYNPDRPSEYTSTMGKRKLQPM
jgi:ribonucleoside-triphosphate reductase